MRLLKITNNSREYLDEFFEDTRTVNIEEVIPRVIDNKKGAKIRNESIRRYDAVFANIPVKNAIFGRVMLEIIEEEDISLNYPSTAFFIMAKKNYLYHVLHEKNIPSPKTVVVADEKAVRGVEDHLKGPLIARKFKELEEVESKKIETVEDIKKFAEGVKYGENIVIFNEHRPGEKYKCLVVGEKIISLKDNSKGWRFSKDNLKYSSLPKKLKDTVRKTSEAIGTTSAEIMLKDNKVVDVNPNPDLEKFREISGKNPYKPLAEALKSE